MQDEFLAALRLFAQAFIHAHLGPAGQQFRLSLRQPRAHGKVGLRQEQRVPIVARLIVSAFRCIWHRQISLIKMVKGRFSVSSLLGPVPGAFVKPLNGFQTRLVEQPGPGLVIRARCAAIMRMACVMAALLSGAGGPVTKKRPPRRPEEPPKSIPGDKRETRSPRRTWPGTSALRRAGQ